jgi:hypothetical protein
MAACSGTTTMVPARPTQELLAAGNDSHRSHQNEFYQARLRIPAACTPGVVLLLLGTGVSLGSDSAVYDISQQSYVIAVELAVDTRAVVIWRRFRVKHSVCLQ